ncbi:transketolase [Pelolinea submarina]|nr:transketolase [Pelolinea submarina]
MSMKINLAQPGTPAEESMADTLGRCLGAFMEEDLRVIAMDADVGLGKMLPPEIINKYPNRYINVGIAEANMLGIACGLSFKDKVPFTYTFCCFAARKVLDQAFLSGAFGGAHVLMIGAMPGVTATINGGSHMAFEDAAVMRAVPEMTVVEPSDMLQGEQVLRMAKDLPGMFYIRWERKGDIRFYENGSTFEIGKAVKLCGGSDVTIIAQGHLCLKEAQAAVALLALEGIRAGLIDMFTLKPIDREAIVDAVRETGCLVTAENQNVLGGLGSAVSEVMAENEAAPLEMVGIRDAFGEVGDLESLKKRYKLTAQDIAAAAKRAISRKQKRRPGA